MPNCGGGACQFRNLAKAIQNCVGNCHHIVKLTATTFSICPTSIPSINHLERRTGNPKIEGEIILGEQSDTRHTEITTGDVMCGFRESEAVVTENRKFLVPILSFFRVSHSCKSSIHVGFFFTCSC